MGCGRVCSIDAICDGWDEDAQAYAFRTKADAPEIDVVVYVDSDDEIAEGVITQLEILAAEVGRLAWTPPLRGPATLQSAWA